MSTASVRFLSDWLMQSNLARYAADLPIIVVLPGGGTSGHLNWKHSGRLHKHRFEDFLMMDIPNHLGRHFQVAGGPWAIGGLRWVATRRCGWA